MSVVVEVQGAEPLQRGACRVIAEAGANHNNSVERAIELAERAAEAGAWAVKYQLYKAEQLVIKDSPKYWTDSFGSQTQFEAFKMSDRLAYKQYEPVAEACRDLGIVFFATPFDLGAVDALEELAAPIYKIASGDITNRDLLEAVASTGKPIVLSTGAATPDEIQAAIDWLALPPEKLVLLACTLTYPTPDEDGNFARLEAFARDFSRYLVGFSDHTLGVAGGWMTAALGGVCIEKHYTLDKSLPDVPDHAMSVDPRELAELVQACTRGALLRGSPAIEVRESEKPARAMARRSVVVLRDIPAGEQLSDADLGVKRPGTGLPASSRRDYVGRIARVPLAEDTQLDPADLTA